MGYMESPSPDAPVNYEESTIIIKAISIQIMSHLVRQMTFNQAHKKVIENLKISLGNKNIKIKWNREHPDEYLFCNTDFNDNNVIHEGEVYDSSKPNGPMNIDSCDVQFKGRQKDIHELLSMINDPTVQLINVYGEKNVGRTSLIKELAKYVSYKKVKNEGIFYFNL